MVIARFTIAGITDTSRTIITIAFITMASITTLMRAPIASPVRAFLSQVVAAHPLWSGKQSVTLGRAISPAHDAPGAPTR
jgi:hypothetical protein